MRIGVVIPTFDRFAQAGAFRRLVLAVEELGSPRLSERENPPWR